MVALAERVQPEAIFHFGAQIDVRKSAADPAFDARVNVVGTINMLEAARVSGRQAVRQLVDRRRDLRRGPAASPRPRRTRSCPRRPTACRKFCAEQYCEIFRRFHGVPGGVAALRQRLRAAPGPARRGRRRSRSSAASCSTASTPTIFGDGKQTRDYVYVDDVVAANLAARRAPRGDRRRTTSAPSAQTSACSTSSTSLKRISGDDVVRGGVRRRRARARCSTSRSTPRARARSSAGRRRSGSTRASSARSPRCAERNARARYGCWQSYGARALHRRRRAARGGPADGRLARCSGWSGERFSAPLRASATEAGERTSDWAAEFWRWLRARAADAPVELARKSRRFSGWISGSPAAIIGVPFGRRGGTHFLSVRSALQHRFPPSIRQGPQRVRRGESQCRPPRAPPTVVPAPSLPGSVRAD